MSYLVLARKYRPQTYKEVIGQTHVTQTLANAIAADRVAHAILFAGPRGTGKTTVARILAKSLNCQTGPTATPCNGCRSCSEITGGHAVDVFEIDGASNNSVDQVRELRESLKYMPAHSAHKIYIIDEVHMLSTSAFNALLKTLEEPPAHVKFIFATTEPQKIPITILSRCQRYDFRRIKIEPIIAHMAALCRLEQFDISDESLGTVAREADGSMRDALSILDQVMACAGDSISDDQVVDILGVVNRRVMQELAAALLARDVPALLDILQECYARGHDIKKFYGDLVKYLRNLLVLKVGRDGGCLVDLPRSEIDMMKRQAEPIGAAQLQQMWEGLFAEEASVRSAAHPRLALELVLIRLCRMPAALPIETLIDKLNSLRQEIAARTDPAAGAIHPPAAEGAAGLGLPSTASALPPVKGAAVEADTPAADPAAGNLRAVKSDPDMLWQQLVEWVAPQNPSLAANLKKCRLATIDDQSVQIEIGGNHIVQTMIQRKKNLADLRGAFKGLLGVDKKIVLKAQPKPASGTRQKKKIEEDHKNQALNNPLVADALEVFNGTLMDVKLR